MKTDKQLHQDVTKELTWEPSVHAEQIVIEVKDGVVTLSGEVSSYPEKWNAESAVMRVDGVRALSVNMNVTPTASTQYTDAEIAESTKNVLRWWTSFPQNMIKAVVKDGWLVLSGNVEWQYKQQAAVDFINKLNGITGAINQIGIKPILYSSDINSNIESTLKRCALDECKFITVEVKDNNVKLTGSVQSLADRDLATRTALNSHGFKNVMNKI